MQIKEAASKEWRVTNFPCTGWPKSREKVVFTELAVRGVEQPFHAGKAQRTASAGPLSSEFQGQMDTADSKFCLWCYKDAWRKGLIQS